MKTSRMLDDVSGKDNPFLDLGKLVISAVHKQLVCVSVRAHLLRIRVCDVCTLTVFLFFILA